MGHTVEIFPTERQKLYTRLADKLETAYNLNRKLVSFQANKDEPMVPRLGQHLGTEVAAQRCRCVEIHDPPEHAAQVLLHREEGESRRPPGLEFHEHIDVALRTGPKSSRNADPKTANRRMPCRRQNAASASRSIATFGLMTGSMILLVERRTPVAIGASHCP